MVSFLPINEVAIVLATDGVKKRLFLIRLIRIMF